MTPQPNHHRAPDEPRLLRIVHPGDVEEAESGLRQGMVSAFLILVILLAGLYLAMQVVSWWHP